MDNYSSEKNTTRSDLSRMNNIDQIRLARLRPDKFDDLAVKEQISLIQQACGDVDPDKIAIVFHECDYNMQKTIARIQAGDFEDGEWQTAKSNHKKKSHNQNDPIINGNHISDSERSSPTSSLRDGYRRIPPRTDVKRREFNNFGRNQFNSRYPPRTNKSVPLSTQPNPSQPTLSTKQSTDELPPIISPSIDEYEFIDGRTETLNFDNSQKELNIKLSSKQRNASAIPQEPVLMHPTVQFSSKPIDIQFGDIQWNESTPRAVTPADDDDEMDNQEIEIPSMINTENQDVQDTLSSNFIDHSTTNDSDNQLSSSLSVSDNTISNTLPTDGTSHLSDQLTDPSSTNPNPYPSQQQGPIHIPITRLPPTASTPRIPEFTSPTAPFIPQTNQPSVTTTSAFTPFNTQNTYPSIPRDYTQTNNWTPQPSTYKSNSKTAIIPAGTYPQQQPYQLPPQQQQQIFLGAYPYSTLPPTVVQVIGPIDHWSPNGYSTPLETYSYPTANYIPTYSNQQQYPQTAKYDQHAYDKEFFAHYGQTRSTNSDPSQSTKDTLTNSKLSPTAATFSQGAPVTASPSSTPLYVNPVQFSMPNYYPTISGTTPLAYSSADNRDNRHGASYNGTNNRTNYYHPGQQQRTYNNHISNSNWHLQQ